MKDLMVQRCKAILYQKAHLRKGVVAVQEMVVSVALARLDDVDPALDDEVAAAAQHSP